MIYKDQLIEINELYLVLFNYYFPSGREKKISFSEIEKIFVYPCTFRTGKWRIWGTGNFRTWFPFDGNRMKRDKVFFMIIKKRWIRIGFTVENIEKVYQIFSEKGLLN